MRSEPENSACDRGREVDWSTAPKRRGNPLIFGGIHCSAPLAGRHWTALLAGQGAASRADSPLEKIPDRLAQTARRCREGAEQVSNRRTPAPTLRVTFGPMAADDGTGFRQLAP